MVKSSKINIVDMEKNVRVCEIIVEEKYYTGLAIKIISVLVFKKLFGHEMIDDYYILLANIST